MDQQLKQRLIGVSIVVALIVIFVPMFFDDKDAQRVNGKGGVPPIPQEVMEQTLELPKSAEDLAPKEEKAEAGSTGYRIIPLTDDVPAKKVEEVADEPATARAQTAKSTERARDAAKSEEEELSAPQEAVKGEETRVNKSAVAENKVAPSNKRSKAGATQPVAPSTVEPVAPSKSPDNALAKTSKPKSQLARPTAEAIHAENEMDVPPFKTITPKASVSVPARPTPVAPPTTKLEAEELTAWVVQAGSFTSEAKAKALAEKLRQSRFAAFVERAPTGTGFTYRVQVGPELDRARAEQVQKQIEDSAGIKGIIVPHP